MVLFAGKRILDLYPFTGSGLKGLKVTRNGICVIIEIRRFEGIEAWQYKIGVH